MSSDDLLDPNRDQDPNLHGTGTEHLEDADVTPGSGYDLLSAHEPVATPEASGFRASLEDDVGEPGGEQHASSAHDLLAHGRPIVQHGAGGAAHDGESDLLTLDEIYLQSPHDAPPPAADVEDDPEAGAHHQLGLNNPFSPHSPRFSENLTEEDVSEVTFGKDGKKIVPSIMLSPEEREAEVRNFVEAEMNKAIDPRLMVLEFGAFQSLEKRLRAVVKEFATPAAAELLMTHTRQAIHIAVVSDPLLSEKEHTEAGLKARINAINSMGGKIIERMEPILSGLEDLGVNVMDVRHGVRTTLEGEGNRLNDLSQTLVPATFGNTLIANAMSLKDNLVNAVTGKKELVGDLRQHRNDRLGKALDDLQEVSNEIRVRAGDREWEEREGNSALALSEKLLGEVAELTKGVEDQLDHNRIAAALAGAQQNLQDAGDTTDSEDHRKALEKMSDMIADAIKGLVEALKKVFGLRGDADGPSTRFSPR